MTSASSSAVSKGKRMADASTMRQLREPVCTPAHTTPANIDAYQLSCSCCGELRNTWQARGPASLDWPRVQSPEQVRTNDLARKARARRNVGGGPGQSITLPGSQVRIWNENENNRGTA